MPIHTTTVIPAEPETTYRDSGYRLVCSGCGLVNIDSGKQVTLVEGRRHEACFNAAGE